MKPKVSLLLEVIALAGIYFCCGRFGLSLAFVHPSATAVWPPSGVSLAALLLRGPRLWPGVFLGALFVNLFTHTSFGSAWGIALGNTLEAVLGAWLVNHYAAGLAAFNRTKTIFNFIVLAAMASTIVSATIGVTSLCLNGFAPWEQYFPIWLTWWLGDMVSNLVIAPLLLVWFVKPNPQWNSRQKGEASGLLILLIWIGQLVFMGYSPVGGNHLALEYLAIPPLLFAAFRLSQHGALSAAFLMSALALWGTRHGHGPFGRADPNQSLLLLQAFMGTITLTAVVLASIIDERRLAETAVRQAREELRKHATDLEVRVRERTGKLQETVESLESLCYTIAHDLRSPLRAIRGYGDVLYEEYGSRLDSTGKSYLVHIQSAAGRMDQLIVDLLELGRLGSVEIPLANVDLEEVSGKALSLLEEEIRRKSAQIHILKPLQPVCANDPILQQILLNLFRNALQFARRDRNPQVQLWTEARDGWVRLSVKDNGVGIEPEHLKRIFQPFEKLFNNASNTGTGMGLAIVRKGIERMGGRVGVDSKPGTGSCFWIELPAMRPQPESDSQVVI